MASKFKVGDKVEGFLMVTPATCLKFRAVVTAAPAQGGNQWTVETREALGAYSENGIAVVEWETIVARCMTVYSHELETWKAWDGCN
ncbi:hypothetical protein RB594_000652 [Gaeumannomyces avenae]